MGFRCRLSQGVSSLLRVEKVLLEVVTVNVLSNFKNAKMLGNISEGYLLTASTACFGLLSLLSRIHFVFSYLKFSF